MSCKFKYDNLTFQSELALDEYLLKKERFEDITKGKSDIVFSTLNSQQQTIHNRIWANSVNTNKLRIESKKISSTPTNVDDSGNIDNDVSLNNNGTNSHASFISVTDLLHTLKKNGSHSTDPHKDNLFPIYDSNAYWGEVFKLYREGNPPEDQIPYVFKDPSDPNRTISLDEDLIKIRQLFQGKHEEDPNDTTGIWGQQKQLGSLAHAIFREFFSAKRKAPYKSTEEIYNDINLKYQEGKLYGIKNKKEWDRINTFLRPTLETCNKVYQYIINDPRWGKNCDILVEQKISADILNPTIDKVQTVLGMIDLLVINPDGKVSIFDYKCSPKDYSQYNSAKVRTYNYQLAIYRKMLQQLGVGNDFTPSLYVIPLKYQNFQYDEDKGIGTIDGLTCEDNPVHELESSQISTGSTYDTVQNQLSNVFRKKALDDNTVMSGLDDANEQMKICFPNYSSQRHVTEKSIQKYIEKHGGIQPDPSTNGKTKMFTHTWKKEKKTIVGSDDLEIYAQIKKLFEDANLNKESSAKSIRSIISEARKSGNFQFTKNTGTTNASVKWVENTLAKYATPDYITLFEEPSNKNNNKLNSFDALGIIGFKNIYTHQIDVIKISSSWDLTRHVDLTGKRKNILGTFLPDVVSMNMPKALNMEAVEGNVELMQVMAVINSALKDELIGSSSVIGNIQVMNPNSQEGMSSDNARLLYNYNELCKHSKYKLSFAGTNNPNGIKMASYVELTRNKFVEILNSKAHSSSLDKIKNSNLSTSINSLQMEWEHWETQENTLGILDSLNDLRMEMEDLFPELRSGKISNEQSELDSPQYVLYADIMEAILQMSKIDTSQQINDHGKFLEGTIMGILKGNGQGWNGSLIDNPGTLQSETLNKISELCTRAYQQSRDKLTHFSEDLRQHVIELRKSKGFSEAERYTFGIQAELYENMFDKEARANGELKFKNPWLHPESMTAAEVKFLKFAILNFANQASKNHNIKTEDDLLPYIMNENVADDYLLVPLTRGDLKSKIVSSGGIIKLFCNQFRYLNPKFIYQRMKDKFLNIYTDDTISKINKGEQWSMPNSFDKGRGMNRASYISRVGGIDFFEQNLETLLLCHSAAYTIKDNMDKNLPLIKALYVHLQYSGIIRNQNFENDLSYLKNFIKSKIYNMPLEDQNAWGVSMTIQRQLMSTASKLVLCFNPTQAYQFIDGIWKDVSLMWRKPTGNTSDTSKEPFDKKNLTESFLWILKDLKHFGPNISMGEAFNMQYGINDMDMNDLAHKLTSDNVGLFNFWDLGFRFSSRPDYYNRLAIFTAQMRADGCFDAHSMVNGKLVYDWTKDARFDAFARGDKSNLQKYNKQKSLYYAIAREFELEGALDLNGQLFRVDLEKPVALPRAYTNKQSESLKAFGDKLYGYYSHEKKSMIQAYSLGTLFMQMNTYWSSKKNQWLAGSGYTQEGYYTQYEETITNDDGTNTKTKWWLKTDENGVQIPTDKQFNEDGSENIPYMIWKGRPSEGILITCARLGRTLVDHYMREYKPDQSAKELLSDEYFHNENPDLRRLYRSNLQQLIFDALAFLIFGCFVAPSLVKLTKEYTKETGNDDFGQAALNNSALIAAKMFSNSTDDFNAVHSILGRGVNWTPFSIERAKSLTNTFKGIVTGQTDPYDGAVRSMAVTNTNAPIMDYIKLNTIGRKIGDNGSAE